MTVPANYGTEYSLIPDPDYVQSKFITTTM